jgi:TorA maturation chaperone TorD
LTLGPDRRNIFTIRNDFQTTRKCGAGRECIALPESTDAIDTVAEEDLLRANIYMLLARLLARPPERATLDTVAGFHGDETQMGQALNALAAAARASAPEMVDDEYHELFIGVGQGELSPYGSYYLTGFLYEKPLANLRVDMEKQGISHGDDVNEPEDHIASLCEMMCGLITGAFGEPVGLAEQQGFFNAHLAPWAHRFFEDLERARAAAFYMPVGAVGKLFMEIESQAFEMAA